MHEINNNNCNCFGKHEFKKYTLIIIDIPCGCHDFNKTLYVPT